MSNKQQLDTKKTQKNDNLIFSKLKSPKFTAVSLQTKSIKWTREEANER